MNVEIGAETPIFLFWEYLFPNFGNLSLQCSFPSSNKKVYFQPCSCSHMSTQSYRSVHGRMNYKDTKPNMSLFFKINLLTDIAALSLTDFIDWRYIHSVVCIFDPACELLPPWTKEQYLCTVAPLPYLLSDLPPPKLNVLYILYEQCVWLGVGGMGGCWIVVLHSVSGQFQNLQICYTTPNKWPVKTTLRGWCL